MNVRTDQGKYFLGVREHIPSSDMDAVDKKPLPSGVFFRDRYEFILRNSGCIDIDEHSPHDPPPAIGVGHIVIPMTGN